MPFARRRLDLLLVPTDPDRLLDPGLAQALEDRGLLSMAGLPRCAGIRVDLPGGPMLYGNQAGGVRVRCPVTSEPAASAVSEGVTSWRKGGTPDVDCPCGRRHALSEMGYEPPAAPGRSALVFVDVDAYLLEAPARTVLDEVLGPTTLIPRRVS